MKKLKLVVISLLVLIMAFSVTGCYTAVPQKMWKVKGTYKLTNYSRTMGKNNSTSTDYLKEKEIVAYLVVTGKSVGYYIYQDKDTPMTKENVSLRYEYSTDEPNKVAHVYYKADGDLLETKLVVQQKKLRAYEGAGIIVADFQYNVDYTWEKECFLTNLWWVNIKEGTNFRK